MPAMTMKSLRALLCTAAALLSVSASAQDKKQDELIERVVVRNRLFQPGGKIELAPSVGFTLVNRLTDHYNFNLGVAWNMSDTLALELRGGYALSRHTGLANQVGEHVMQRDPNPPRRDLVVVDDLSGLWEMKANGAIGVRWAPVYGKISLLAELPVHFQAYLWAGAGAGTFHRQSIVYCATTPDRGTGACGADNDQWLTEDKVSWLGSAAFGMRFFTHQKGAIKIEVRDYMYPDAFLEDIDRTVSEKSGDTTSPATGTPASNPGLINLVLLDIGYTFFF